MYVLFAAASLCIHCEIPPLIPFSNIKTMSISVSNSNFTPVYFKHASNASPGVVENVQDLIYVSPSIII